MMLVAIDTSHEIKSKPYLTSLLEIALILYITVTIRGRQLHRVFFTLLLSRLV